MTSRHGEHVHQGATPANISSLGGNSQYHCFQNHSLALIKSNRNFKIKKVLKHRQRERERERGRERRVKKPMTLQFLNVLRKKDIFLCKTMRFKFALYGKGFSCICESHSVTTIYRTTTRSGQGFQLRRKLLLARRFKDAAHGRVARRIGQWQCTSRISHRSL